MKSTPGVILMPLNSQIPPCVSHHVLFKGQDEADNFQEEDERMEVFSRRKLESNWDRYEESERQEPDDDMPTRRGADYHVLLGSAGKVSAHEKLETSQASEKLKYSYNAQFFWL